MQNDFKTIEKLRKITGTLPNEKPIKRTRIIPFDESLEVTLEDYSNNPYKALFVTATSTWGNNEFKSKWGCNLVLPLEAKLEVLKAVLTHNTLPQAMESVLFTFRVKGVPRWLFDYHTQNANFISFMSIGCRDNSKLDADIVKLPQINDDILFDSLKNLYEKIVEDGSQSWQTARAFLPLSYSHSYHFVQNLLSVVSVKGFRGSAKFNVNNFEDVHFQHLYKKVVDAISEKFPLLGLYCQILFKDNEEVLNKIKNMTIDDIDSRDLKFLL